MPNCGQPWTDPMIPTLTMRPLFAVSVGFMPHIVEYQNYLEEWPGLINLSVVKGSQKRQSSGYRSFGCS